MPNSRSISAEVWAHARECLVFYFSRRHARSDAEDLAQQTLLSIWEREDYEFEKEEDFLRVCYGFAHKISQEQYRATMRHSGSPLDDSFAAPANDSSGVQAMESRLLLAEVCEIGRARLHNQEWEMIQKSVECDRSNLAREFQAGGANNLRVRLHRARKRLAKLAGLK